MVSLPSLGTIIATCVGIMISILTAYLTHKIKQRDEEIIRYRKEREAKEQADLERRDEERLLTMGMARTMLLQNYEYAVKKGYYSISEREVYHALYEAYKGAGGNGVIEDLAEKIVLLPTVPPKETKSRRKEETASEAK